jgi:hypothetical protein
MHYSFNIHSTLIEHFEKLQGTFREHSIEPGDEFLGALLPGANAEVGHQVAAGLPLRVYQQQRLWVAV